MALKARLTVTGEQGQSLGPLGSFEFGQAGGIIGRSAACDWRLPDPTNTLSARHAEIRFTGQGFTIADLSTNGVYVNVTDAPLGRGNTALLVSGDFVYIGPYVISVDIVRVPDQVSAPVAPSRAPPLSAPPLSVAPLSAPPVAVPPLSVPPLSASPRAALGGFAPRARGETNARTPLDPLAALDGEDTLQETDNPFKDLGIGKRDRDRSDLSLRTANVPPSGPIPDFGFAPTPPPPPPPPPFAPARPAVPPLAAPNAVPPFAVPPMAVQPAPVAPPAPASTPAPAPPSADGPVIPPDFLDELSALIPRLADAPKPAPDPFPAPVQPPAPPPVLPPSPPPRAPIPPTALAPSPDDPEAMVTMLRLRGRAKPQAAGAPPVPAPPPAPAPVQAPPPVPAAPASSGATQSGFWELFGLDPNRLSAEERDRVLADVAGLIGGLVTGLLELQATRRRMKSELNLDSTQLAGDDNPFHTAGSAQEALRTLFATGRPVRRAPEAEARAVFREMQIHELAAMDAMQATIARLMQRISPAAITFEIEGEGQNGGVFGRRVDKAKLWDRYLVMHERLVDALDVLSPELVGQEFARAYAHHVQTMRGGQG